MVSLNVDGLISGLDTSSIISQLMTLERQPQQRLVSKRDEINKVAELYRSLNTRFGAIETAAQKLSAASGWKLTKASTSDASIATVTGSPTAPASAIAFRVASLAASHTVVSTGSVTDADAGGQFAAGFSVAGITIGDVGGGSLREVAAAINSAVSGVTATVVRTSPTDYRLQIASRATGAASAFTVDGTGLEALGTVDQVVSQGRDAELVVGNALDTPYTVTSASNTVTDLVPGVTITLRKADPTATVSVGVAPDGEALADRVAALVTSVNDAATFVRTNAKYDQTSRKAGAFLGDQVATRLSSALVTTITGGVAGATITPRTAGISVSRDGVLSFDRAAFLAAWEDDPDAVQTLFAGGGNVDTADDGLAEKLRLAAKDATDHATGRITSAIESRVASAKSLDAQIASWDNRLTLREQALRRQFSALETALSRAQSQGQWLSGQIASLPSWSS